MSNQLKRMSFSIYMDPAALESDRYALGVLQNWFARAKKIQGDGEEFDFSKSRFHKDIYLSGMFMYVLSPNLCKAMANALGPEQVTLSTLRHVFGSCGFSLGDGVSGAASGPSGEAMVDMIVARLGPLLKQGGDIALPDNLADELAHRLSPLVAQTGSESRAPALPDGFADELMTRLSQLDTRASAPIDTDALASAIADKLPVPESTPSAPAPKVDISGEIGVLQSQLSNLTKQLEEQTRIIRDQHRLIQRLAAAPRPAASGDGAGAEAPAADPVIEDLSSQVASMQKIKAKGIF
ncbi:MAG: hypothetical protein ACRCYV_05205 [Aeromonas sp.]